MTLGNDIFIGEIGGGLVLIFLLVQLRPILVNEFYKSLKRRREQAAIIPKPSRQTIMMNRQDEMSELNHRAELAVATARAEVAENNLEIFRQKMQENTKEGQMLIALPPTEHLDPLKNTKVPSLKSMEDKISSQGTKII